MNTVKKGDEFEDQSHDIIEKILNSGELSLIPSHCTIHRKKRYPAEGRSNGIVFDLSIEVKPPNANNLTMLYLIECKNYSSPISVDEVSLFVHYKNQIKGYTTKGVFITNNRLQQGALEQIEHNGLMLIEVDEKNYNIIHYKNSQGVNEKEKEYDNLVLSTLSNILLPKQIEGLNKFSRKEIENIALTFLNMFNPRIVRNVTATPIFDLLDFLKNEYGVQLQYIKELDDSDNEILGYYNSETNVICISSSIKGTVREPFVIGHEIGHFVLHKDLKVNKTIYNNFRDTRFNFFKQSYSLDNPKNWIEWQANVFSSALLLPEISFRAMLIGVQKELGISKAGRIFLDSQECNIKDYEDIKKRLASHFNVSKTNVEFRLNNLKLIKKPKKVVKEDDVELKEFIRRMSIFKANTYE